MASVFFITLRYSEKSRPYFRIRMWALTPRTFLRNSCWKPLVTDKTQIMIDTPMATPSTDTAVKVENTAKSTAAAMVRPPANISTAATALLAPDASSPGLSGGSPERKKSATPAPQSSAPMMRPVQMAGERRGLYRYRQPMKNS